jgi:alpha-tubulin suppressor-like RCC1 family protein
MGVSTQQKGCFMSTRAFAIGGTLLLAALGCRDDTTAPTESAHTSQVPNVAAAVALSFSQITAGNAITCGITAVNRAYCWGSNYNGQLGDGTTTERHRPVAVATTLRFRQISATDTHACGVTTGFTAYCWGGNQSGGIGDGTTTPRLRPVAVKGGHQFQQISVGFFTTCAVGYPDNRVYCWGSNAYGQLGDGTTSRRLTPVAVLGGRRFLQVDLGFDHACGVTVNGAFCWGLNNLGQLGDGTTTTRLAPRLVIGGHQWRQVDAGGYHSCGVTTANRAYCWGNGASGQIGDGTTSKRYSPRAVVGGLYFTRITAGGFHSCGVTPADRAYCWGRNQFGTVGDGSTVTERWFLKAVQGGFSFQQVSAGADHTCGRTTSGVAYCWGWNGAGELGDGTQSYRLVPMAVVGPS